MPQSLEDRIKGITIGGVTSDSKMFLICGATFKDDVGLTIFQRTQGDAFVHNIFNLLEEEGLKPQLELQNLWGNTEFVFDSKN